MHGISPPETHARTKDKEIQMKHGLQRGATTHLLGRDAIRTCANLPEDNNE